MIHNIELLNTNLEVVSQFQDKLRRLKGEITIFIHPFYNVETKPVENKRYVKGEYLKKRDEFIKNYLVKNGVLVVFQQENDYIELIPELEKLGNGIVYTIKTEMGKHYPMGGDVTWNKFIDILNVSGIKHVILGGMYLVNYKSELATKMYDPKYDEKGALLNYVKNMPEYIDKYQKASEWIKKDIVPTGCVGYAAMEFLNSGIDVTFSTLTTPCSATEYFTN